MAELSLDVTDQQGTELRFTVWNAQLRVMRPGRLRVEVVQQCEVREVEIDEPDAFVVAGQRYVAKSPAEAAAFAHALGRARDEQAARQVRSEEVSEQVSMRGLPASLRLPLSDSSARWQYAVVNVGAFNSPDRMSSLLAFAGQAGWELITVYDTASNWFGGMEKGFMLLKRPVPPGVDVDEWCIQLRHTG